MTRHIFLIGFMGSGKTHWGRILAAELGRPFVDLDAFIETNEGRTISEIFASSGEKGFRVLEREYLLRLAALPPAVVATGGGTPCFFDNMRWMKQYGRTVYLKIPPEVLFERLKGGRQHRPLLKNMNDDALRAFIRERLAMREPFYNLADAVLTQEVDEKMSIELLISQLAT